MEILLFLAIGALTESQTDFTKTLISDKNITEQHERVRQECRDGFIYEVTSTKVEKTPTPCEERSIEIIKE